MAESLAWPVGLSFAFSFVCFDGKQEHRVGGRRLEKVLLPNIHLFFDICNPMYGDNSWGASWQRQVHLELDVAVRDGPRDSTNRVVCTRKLTHVQASIR